VIHSQKKTTDTMLDEFSAIFDDSNKTEQTTMAQKQQSDEEDYIDSMFRSNPKIFDPIAERLVVHQTSLLNEFSRQRREQKEEGNISKIISGKTYQADDLVIINKSNVKEASIREEDIIDQRLIAHQNAIIDEITQERKQKAASISKVTRTTRQNPPPSDIDTAKKLKNEHYIPKKKLRIPPSIDIALEAQQQIPIIRRSKRPRTGIIEVCPGTYVHIHSSRQARRAVANGEAIVVGCYICQKQFQIPKWVRILYCTNCNNLSPLQEEQVSPYSDIFDGQRGNRKVG